MAAATEERRSTAFDHPMMNSSPVSVKFQLHVNARA
jgi:hypothetical protein